MHYPPPTSSTSSIPLNPTTIQSSPVPMANSPPRSVNTSMSSTRIQKQWSNYQTTLSSVCKGLSPNGSNRNFGGGGGHGISQVRIGFGRGIYQYDVVRGL
ncbi:hypothetical protein TL16_g10103 [Triparma laevis f. inornata]|uniref:Uncharacterized protein n=1 Tax=Triparma laevis f. inornata TaxID=1714386 RepID=A0A9W7BAG9_9STRA|nr:hypothetical protein TL16_g10103 [Triparma laevis f. inornata]